MSEIQKWILYICPQTHVRTVKGDRWLFGEGVTDDYLINFGTKKYNEKVLAGKKNPGSANSYYNRKYAIKKYFDYKRALKEQAERQNFIMPKKNGWVRFYLPMPPSWSDKKKSRMCFELHESKPDADNLIKSLKDSLLSKDQTIADYRGSKFWYSGVGHIEITIGELPPAKGYTSFQREDKIK